jgi:hypothetical protein
MHTTRTPRRARRLAMLATTLVVGAGALVSSEAALATPSSGCAYDRPCFTDAYYTKSRNIYLTWKATESFSHYNVIWSRPGKAPRQIEVSGGRTGQFRLGNINAYTTYRFSVQGCNTRFLASSKCSPWEPAQVRVGSLPPR